MQCTVAKWKRNADNRQVGFALTPWCCGIQAEFTVGKYLSLAWFPGQKGGWGPHEAGTLGALFNLNFNVSTFKLLQRLCLIWNLRPHAESESSPQSEQCSTWNNPNQVCGAAEGTKPQGTCPGKNLWARMARSKLNWNLKFLENGNCFGALSHWDRYYISKNVNYYYYVIKVVATVTGSHLFGSWLRYIKEITNWCLYSWQNINYWQEGW